MKLCPKCKAELDDNVHFCVQCMTSLEGKEQIPLPVYRRRLPWVLFGSLLGCVLLAVALILVIPEKETPMQPAPQTQRQALEQTVQPTESEERKEISAEISQQVNGVTYTFRKATKEDYPSAINLQLGNYYVLIRVEGTPADGTYRVPSFADEAMTAPVTVVADGAFAGTKARSVDLGNNVRLVWDDGFGGCALKNLYLHTDVYIEEAAFSGCSADLTIHGPDYLENTKGMSWPAVAAEYGFRWQTADF